MTVVIQPISMSTRCITPGTSPPPRFSSAIFGRRQFAPTKPTERKRADRRTLRVDAGNANSGGLFAPVVIVVRDIVGKKRFNKFRGKAIQLHSQVRKLRFLFLPVFNVAPCIELSDELSASANSQVIGEFCKEIGADSSIKQDLIRMAKDNGGKLGFLA
jgi:hypothetical protein